MEINKLLKENFEKWLKTLGYAPSTTYVSTSYVRDFFFYLKSLDITHIEEITPRVMEGYYRYLQSRGHKRQPGSLSQNYITANMSAIKRFNRFLQVTGRPFFEIPLKGEPGIITGKTILTRAEIKALYRACDSDYLGIRDRAVLGIYYGCGLRRSEGLALDTPDILLGEKRILVRKGKHYRQRWVPITESLKEDLEEYLYGAREKILGFKNIKTHAFFLSTRVNRLCGNALISRIHRLAKAANIDKETGVHTLRHSIATHLLQSGMTLEEVSHFLGHSSLESTQIYTHLAHEI